MDINFLKYEIKVAGKVTEGVGSRNVYDITDCIIWKITEVSGVFFPLLYSSVGFKSLVKLKTNKKEKTLNSLYSRYKISNTEQ